jgi:hypothetical protein
MRFVESVKPIANSIAEAKPAALPAAAVATGGGVVRTKSSPDLLTATDATVHPPSRDVRNVQAFLSLLCDEDVKFDDDDISIPALETPPLSGASCSKAASDTDVAHLREGNQPPSRLAIEHSSSEDVHMHSNDTGPNIESEDSVDFKPLQRSISESIEPEAGAKGRKRERKHTSKVKASPLNQRSSYKPSSTSTSDGEEDEHSQSSEDSYPTQRRNQQDVANFLTTPHRTDRYGRAIVPFAKQPPNSAMTALSKTKTALNSSREALVQKVANMLVSVVDSDAPMPLMRGKTLAMPHAMLQTTPAEDRAYRASHDPASLLDPHAAKLYLHEKGTVIDLGTVQLIQFDQIIGLDDCKTKIQENIILPKVNPALCVGLSAPSRLLAFNAAKGSGIRTTVHRACIEHNINLLVVNSVCCSKGMFTDIMAVAKAHSPCVVLLHRCDDLFSPEQYSHFGGELMAEWEKMQDKGSNTWRAAIPSDSERHFEKTDVWLIWALERPIGALHPVLTTQFSRNNSWCFANGMTGDQKCSLLKFFIMNHMKESGFATNPIREALASLNPVMEGELIGKSNSYLPSDLLHIARGAIAEAINGVRDNPKIASMKSYDPALIIQPAHLERAFTAYLPTIRDNIPVTPQQHHPAQTQQAWGAPQHHQRPHNFQATNQ